MARPAIRIWPDLGLLTAFWIYVALTNVVWGASMSASLARIGVTDVFASWNARVVQHLLLYPPLIICMWISRRIGWQPLWRTLPMQLLFAAAFSALANPMMDVAEAMVGMLPWQRVALPFLPSAGAAQPPQQAFSWIASLATFLISYSFCLALLAGFEFYRRFRDSQLHSAALERSLSAAHLAALRMQLSPHTLFNLLHTIRGHVTWDPATAQSMIVQLGDLLHRVLQAGEHELSPLHDELELARLYLQLQQKRFPDRLVVNVSDPDPNLSRQIWTPSLILQPLVENAVVHGLAHPQATVSIRVEVALDREVLILRVMNSLPPDGGTADPEHTGIGLKNVRERLAIQFGDRATFHAGRDRGNDWIAEIQMPVLHNGG